MVAVHISNIRYITFLIIKQLSNTFFEKTERLECKYVLSFSAFTKNKWNIPFSFGRLRQTAEEWCVNQEIAQVKLRINSVYYSFTFPLKI